MSCAPTTTPRPRRPRVLHVAQESESYPKSSA